MITALFCLFLFTLNRTGYAITAGALPIWFFLFVSLVLDAMLAAMLISAWRDVKARPAAHAPTFEAN